MKWQIEKPEPWRPWFAWYPIRLSYDLNNTGIWWEWVERKIEYVQGYRLSRYRPLSPDAVGQPTDFPILPRALDP